MTVDLGDERRRWGITQADLADRAGVSLGTIRDLEQRRSVTRTPTRRALELALELDPDALAYLEAL